MVKNEYEYKHCLPCKIPFLIMYTFVNLNEFVKKLLNKIAKTCRVVPLSCPLKSSPGPHPVTWCIWNLSYVALYKIYLRNPGIGYMQSNEKDIIRKKVTSMSVCNNAHAFPIDLLTLFFVIQRRKWSHAKDTCAGEMQNGIR